MLKIKRDKNFKVLFGFNFETAERAIFTNIESYGLKVQGTSRYTKTMIRDYIKKNPDLDAIFLKEYLDGGEKYGALEIAELADECDANFVVIMRSANRGREAMKILYCAGITGAVFADGKRGADPKILAKLAVDGRKRKEAREYYKVDAPMPDYGVLNFEDFRDTYSYLIGNDIPGSTVIDRFIDITRFLSPKQLSSFIKELPDDDLGDLQSFEEFYEITNGLRQRGYLLTRYKKPKNVMRAVDKDSAALVKDVTSNIEYEQKPVLESVRTSSSLDDVYDVSGSLESGYAVSEGGDIALGRGDVPSEEEAEIQRVRRARKVPKQAEPTYEEKAYGTDYAESSDDAYDDSENTVDNGDAYDEQPYEESHEQEVADNVSDGDTLDNDYTSSDKIAYQTDDLLDINKLMYGTEASASYERESEEISDENLSSLNVDELLSKYS